MSSYKEQPRWTLFSGAVGRAEGSTLIPGQFANKAGFSAALTINLEFLLCLAQQCGNFVLWVLCQVGIFVGISGLFLFGAFPSKVSSGVKRGLFPKSSGSCPSVSSVCWWAGTPVIWFFTLALWSWALSLQFPTYRMGRGWYLDYMGGSLNVFRHTWYSLSTVYHLFWLVPLNIILLLGLKIKILHHLVPLASLSSTLYLFWLHVFNSSLGVLSSIPAGPCPWDILFYLSHIPFAQIWCHGHLWSGGPGLEKKAG